MPSSASTSAIWRIWKRWTHFRIRCDTCNGSFGLLPGVAAHDLQLEGMERIGVQDFEVYIHSRVPLNDGGLCLGQAAVRSQLAGRDPNKYLAVPLKLPE